MILSPIKIIARRALFLLFVMGVFVVHGALAAETGAGDTLTAEVAGAEESISAEKIASVEKVTADSAAKKTSPVSTVMADNNVTANLLQTTLGLLAVLAMIAAAAWAVKRFGGFRIGAQGQMKVMGGLSLGSRERVVLLQVGGQQLVLGVSPGQIRTLHVLDEPLPGTAGNSDKDTGNDESNVSFAGRLQAALKQNTQDALKGKGRN